MENARPRLEVKSRRVGGATYQVPVEISFERQESLALRWIVTPPVAARVCRCGRLAAEIVDAYNNTGSVVKKKEDTHKMAQANRAFAHLRW
jgi:small subunit ribosomal protein S7